MNTLKEKKKILLKRKIVDTTIQSIRELGYDQVTMEGIARSCDITKRTLYKYFPVKEAILSEFIKRTFVVKKEERLNKLKELDDFRSRIEYYMKDLMEGVMREPVIFEKYIIYVMKKLVSYEQKGNDASGMSEPIALIMKSGFEEGCINQAIPKMLVMDFFTFSFVELTKMYYLDTENFDLEKMSGICTDMFIKGIKN